MSTHLHDGDALVVISSLLCVEINEFGAKALVPIVGEDIPLEHLQWAKAVNLNQSMNHLKWKDASDDDNRSLHKGFYKNGGIILYRDGREVVTILASILRILMGIFRASVLNSD